MTARVPFDASAIAEVPVAPLNPGSGIQCVPSIEDNAIAWAGGCSTPTAISPPVDGPTPKSWPTAGAWQGEQRYPGSRDGATVTIDGCARSTASQAPLAVGADTEGVAEAGVVECADGNGVTGTVPQPVTMRTSGTGKTNLRRMSIGRHHIVLMVRSTLRILPCRGCGPSGPSCLARDRGPGPHQPPIRKINPAMMSTPSITTTNTRSGRRSTIRFPVNNPATMMGPSARPVATDGPVSSDALPYATAW